MRSGVCRFGGNQNRANKLEMYGVEYSKVEKSEIFTFDPNDKLPFIERLLSTKPVKTSTVSIFKKPFSSFKSILFWS